MRALSVKSERGVGAEALVRWQRPGKGLILPGRFIPALEENGLMPLLDCEVLRIVCRDIREAREGGIDPGWVSVNLSQLHAGHYSGEMVGRRAREAVARDRLRFELTETAPSPDGSGEMLDFARRLQSQGMTLEQYMQYLGQTIDQLIDQMRPQALKQIQTRLVLEKVAEVENIEVSDEKIDEEIQRMAKMYNMEADKLKDIMGDYEKEQMKKDLAVQEAVTFLADNAVEVDAPAEAAGEEAPEKTEE